MGASGLFRVGSSAAAHRFPLEGLRYCTMTGESSADLQDLIDRLRRGDESARRELLQRAHDRVLRIAAKIVQEDFPGLRGRHDLESVVSEVWIRMTTALESTQPQTVDGFFGLVFQKVRQVLLDIVARERRVNARRREGPLDANEPEALANCDQADTTHDPKRLAMLTEFHEQVEKLPGAERTVFEMRYYGGYAQAEIAQLLGLHPRQVSRHWMAATERLAKWLDGFDAPF
jgi:RNA polymerase sigma factor (sigma-70 family)